MPTDSETVKTSAALLETLHGIFGPASQYRPGNPSLTAIIPGDPCPSDLTRLIRPFSPRKRHPPHRNLHPHPHRTIRDFHCRYRQQRSNPRTSTTYHNHPRRYLTIRIRLHGPRWLDDNCGDRTFPTWSPWWNWSECFVGGESYGVGGVDGLDC